MQTKSVEQSQVTMANVMLPQHANPEGNVHGGEIMKLMDNAAGVVAARHSRTTIVTARVDEMEFHHPVRVGNVVTCHGKLTFVGNSSMEVLITVMVEDLYSDAPPKKALTAYFTMVALNCQGRPASVPRLEPRSEEDLRLWEEGKSRYLRHKG